MKYLLSLVLLLSVLLFCACGLKSIILPEPRVQPGDEIFSKAEDLFRAQSYKKAFEEYNTYLSQFPRGHLAPAALKSMGDIQILLGNAAESRRIYQRLVEEYPKSPLVPDTKIAIISTYYYEGDYSRAAQGANELIGELDTGRHLARIYTLLGDTYKALSSPVDAIKSYTKAFQYAEPEEKEKSLNKLKVEIEKLTSPDIISLLSLLEGKTPAGYLLYQLGVNYIKEERIGKAEKILSEFIETFPEHEMVPKAKGFLLDLKKESAYDHHSIGCLLPLSGRYKAFGERALKGIELALSQFTASDPSGPSQLRLIIKDSGSDAEKATQGVRELSEEKVAAIIGPLISAEEAIYEAQREKIPIITLVQQQDITDVGDFVFRNFLTPRMQAKAVVSYAVTTLGLKKFAILFPEENYGTTFMNVFWDEVLEKKAVIVGVESYSPGMMDFADPIKKLIGLYYPVPDDLKKNEVRYVNIDESLVPFDPITPPSVREISGKSKNHREDSGILKIPLVDKQEKAEEELLPLVDFDAIFIPDAPKKAGLIIPQLSFFDIKNVYLFGTNLWHSNRFIDMAEEYVQGAILTEGFFTQSVSKEVRDFVSSFLRTYGESPEYIEAVAYDSAMMLFQTVSRPDINYRQTLRDELMNVVDYHGVTGISSVDHKGEVQKKLFLLRIQGDRFVEINDTP